MSDMNFEQARHNMIEQQIRTWEVLDDGVLNLLERVPREDFVPPEYRKLAFTDMQIPLGRGEVMMEPKLEARMLQALDIQPDEMVLEVGTGSGYVTALLAALAKHVYTVEVAPEFKIEAEKKLADHGIDNVTLDVADAARGWERHGPYDVIAVTGSMPLLTDDLQKSLNIGGRMFVIVGDAPAMEALLITRVGEDQWQKESLFETVIPPLANAPQPPRFEF